MVTLDWMTLLINQAENTSDSLCLSPTVGRY